MKITPRLAAKLARDWWWRRRQRRRGTSHGAVLMYHRVATARADPWNLCVTPERFQAQLAALCAMADVVPLTELPARLQAGARSRPVVAVTFDDAYLDTLTAARPALQRHDVPATVFVPTGWVGSPQPVWWDLLACAVLENPRLPVRGRFEAHTLNVSWELAANDPVRGARARRRLHDSLWASLRELDDPSRRSTLAALVDALNADVDDLRDVRVMTPDELRCLTADGLVQLGSHAVSHPSLPGLGSADKAREIRGSARQFEDLFGHSPRTFAYPYGDLDPESVELVRDTGYELACSTREDLVWGGGDPMLLPRLAIGNWGAREFRLRLERYWFA